MGEAIIFIINSNFAFRDGNPSATADGTDCFQVRFWTFEAKPPNTLVHGEFTLLQLLWTRVKDATGLSRGGFTFQAK
jgi:hypothetical protein